MALVIAIGGGIGIGVLIGSKRLALDVSGADPDRALFDAQDHALPRDPAVLRLGLSAKIAFGVLHGSSR